MAPTRLVTLSLMCLLATLSGCSRVYSVDGKIVDGDGNGIEGASINFYPHDWKRQEFGRADGTSEADGSFKADWGNAVGVELFNMVVSKEGYREQVQLVKADARDLRIVMERVGNTDSMNTPRFDESHPSPAE